MVRKLDLNTKWTLHFVFSEEKALTGAVLRPVHIIHRGNGGVVVLDNINGFNLRLVRCF